MQFWENQGKIRKIIDNFPDNGRIGSSRIVQTRTCTFLPNVVDRIEGESRKIKNLLIIS
jgi:hypothetical protein